MMKRIGDKACLNLRCNNFVVIDRGFIAESGSVIKIDCANKVEIRGGEIKKGAKVIISGKDIQIKQYLNVEQGGQLQIINR